MNKQTIKEIVLVIIIFFSLVTFPVHADSGWGGSYDSGGSSSWGSSSSSGSSSSGSSSSWDHSSSSSSSSSAGGGLSSVEVIIGIFFIVFIMIIAVIILMIRDAATNAIIKQSREKERVHNSIVNSTDAIINQSTSKRKLEEKKIENTEEKIKKILPNFSEKQLKQDVFTIYKKIQVAWMDFDYDTLRKYCTDELYNMYYQQLEVLKQKKQKNVMKNFSQHNFYIESFSHNEKEIAIKVRTLIQCYDYVVSEDNQVVRGSDRMMRLYDYEMTFTQGIKQGGNNKCPNCGAPIENSNSSICSYCHSKITKSANYDLVLAKKEVISQHSV